MSKPRMLGLAIGLGLGLGVATSAREARATTCSDVQGFNTTNPAWSACKKMATYDPAFAGGDENDEPVIIYNAAPVAPATLKYQVLVYFHGGGGTAAAASQFLQRAAQAGYDVVGIDYHGFDGAQQLTPLEICGCFTECYGQWFDRQWRGGDSSHPGGAGMPTVPLNSGVSWRLWKILTYYKNKAGWDNRWDSYIDVWGHVDWTRVTVVGHSQGTGIASYIAQYNPVHKVIIFSGLQWTLDHDDDTFFDYGAVNGVTCTADEIPPAWITGTNWVTPRNNFWGLVDTADDHYPHFVTVLTSTPLELDALHNPNLPDEFTHYGPGPQPSNPANSFRGYHVIEADDLCGCESAAGCNGSSAHNATIANNLCTPGHGLGLRNNVWDFFLKQP